MKAFEMIRHWDEEPVTVFASNLAHAEEIYAAWIKAHHPGRFTAPHMAHTYEGKLLDARPVLASAANLNVAGIGYYDTRFGLWMITDADAPPKGPLVPPSSGINYYRVSSDDGDDAMVFASSFAEATTFYLAWHLDGYDEAPRRVEIHERPRWDLVMAMATLRDEMEAGMSGIAGWSTAGHWHIYEPVSGDRAPPGVI